MSSTSAKCANTVRINSPLVQYNENDIVSNYKYDTTRVNINESTGEATARPVSFDMKFKTSTKLPRLGVMLVGWGGNNGSTLTAGIIANRDKLKWFTNRGEQSADYIGSITQSATLRLGTTDDGRDVYVPFKGMLPMVDPNTIVLGGWDINDANLAQSMLRAQVLDYDLLRQLVPKMESLQPLPSIYYPDFIASNQGDRANNVIPGDNKKEHVEHLRRDIRQFKEANSLDKVIVLWTANTERFCDILPYHLTAEGLLQAIDRSEAEVSASTVFAVASILEGCPYINGSPQNTFVPGLIELAKQHKVPIGGDDFKTGQTKIKSVLVDYLVSAGIKPVSIVSYNHLGNNDGKNLSAPQQFRSKEITKSNVVDDMVESNRILYDEGEKPDHTVVIKYVPYVGDSKRAMDEYTSRIFMNGHNTIVLHNTCEDSCLAAPLMLDLIILTELMTRVSYKTVSMREYKHFHPVLSILSYLLKAPLVPQEAPVINALNRQRACIENIFRACLGLKPENCMYLEHKTELSQKDEVAVTRDGYASTQHVR